MILFLLSFFSNFSLREAFYDAVKQLAGAETGLNVVDKAQTAINSVKIIQALNSITDILKVGLNLYFTPSKILLVRSKV